MGELVIYCGQLESIKKSETTTFFLTQKKKKQQQLAVTIKIERWTTFERRDFL